jgi:hypothetical protein
MNEAGKLANIRIRDKRFETPVCDPSVPHWTFKSAFSDPKKTPVARTPVSVGTCTANNTPPRPSALSIRKCPHYVRKVGHLPALTRISIAVLVLVQNKGKNKSRKKIEKNKKGVGAAFLFLEEGANI